MDDMPQQERDGRAIRKLNPAVAGAVLFSMRDLPMLDQGTTYDPLSCAENLWLSVKVYASGGENALHSHGGEDHAFIVMQGEAVFTFEDGSTSHVRAFEGVMIPRNVKYKFLADEKENLVLLRVGGGQRSKSGLDNLTVFGTPRDVNELTTFADGERKIGNAPKNGESSKPRVYAKGKYFAPDRQDPK